MRQDKHLVRYAELAVTTNFSFLRGASHPEELVESARALELAGIGVADRNSIAGVVRAHMAAKEAGLKLAVGARLVFADGTPDILAYPQDRAGWGRLTRLLTVGKSRTDKGECTLYLDDLIEHVTGLNLIVMPPARLDLQTLGAQIARLSEAAARAVWLAASMLYRGDDTRRLARLAALAGEARVPLIAVNDVLYHAPERRALQDVVTCIREHVTIDAAGRRLQANAERHLKPPAEMARLFRKAPEAIGETVRFIERSRFSLDELKKTEYPEETRQGFATPQDALVALTKEGAGRRYPNGMRPDIRRALDHELAVTAELQYAPYFLTVHDIVRYARSKGILCQGRGSAANSVICYCLGITEVDPEKVDLLFERFVSAERREPPDIDVDFEHERREEVIQYIYRRYGRARAGIAATVIRYRGRSAIREVGKAFGLSEDTVGMLASTLWGWSMEGVGGQEARRAGLDPSEPRLAQVLALTQELMGFPRHLSQHVGGFVITRSRLDEVVPVENAAMEDRTVIEWDKDDLNDLDLLKVDVLGLGMLSCLRRSFDLLKEYYVTPDRRVGKACPSVSAGKRAHADIEAAVLPRGHGARAALLCPPYDIPLDLASIQDEDEAVYRMLSRADSIGVFQVESRAQMSMLPRLRPKEFYDLVIEVAIVRPGPIQGDMVHPYLRRRQKLEPVIYPSPDLEAILHKTLGVPLFQEHVMRIAIVAAGFEPAKADRLRRAMATFKRVGTIDKFRAEFVAGMVARNYARDFAERCFKQIEGFGEYGFPESHAASFALLVYASAWIKCHYPDVFAAALLNSQPMGFYAPAQIVRDAQEHGVEVRPVDVNFSDWDCSLEALSPPVTPVSSPAKADDPVLTGRRNGHSMPFTSSPVVTGWPAFTGHDSQKHENEAARLHPRHADMATDIRSTHALRLGLRQASGLSQAHGLKIESVRGRGFDSIRDLWLRTGLPPASLEKLAQADAFRSLGLDRRDALWAIGALQRAGDKDDLPLFKRVAMPELEPDVHLPPMRPGEHVIEDYRSLHLSLKAHPVSFLRSELDARGIVPHERLPEFRDGARVTVAGLVLVRQRPGDAKAIFMTLEDETGVANTIVWLRTFEIFRPVVLGARLISVTGKLQNESGVIHIVAERMEDLSPLLRRLSQDSSLARTLARADAVPRGDDFSRAHVERPRHPRAGDALVTFFKDKDARIEHLGTTDAAAVMPKGRNFH
jgi:error-prone DNA polymerase